MAQLDDPGRDIVELGPQHGRRRLILPAPVGRIGTSQPNPEPELLAQLNPETVMMMGDNPALPKMSAKPRLIEFFRRRSTFAAMPRKRSAIART